MRRSRPRPRPGEPLEGYRAPEADGVLRPLSGRRRRVRRPARGAREAAAQRLVVHLRARDVGRARLRLPVRLPRAAAHGDRPRAARARVRPRARRHRAERRVPRAHDQRRRRGRRQPVGDPAAERRRVDRGAVRQRHDPHAVRVRRHAHGALPGPAGRDAEDGLPLRGAGRARLRRPAGRDRHGLLRPDEVAHRRATRASTTSRPATASRSSSRSTSC